MVKIFLSLGSNIGDRGENILSALSFLQSSGYVDICKISSFYETSAVGPRQKSFYNIAVKATTALKPQDLLLLVKRAEEILGRKKSKRWGRRLIDIDILFFGSKTVKTKNLVIPHKEVQNRLFALVPLSEIAANFIHPLLNRKINMILKNNLLTLKEQKVKIVAK